MRSIRKQDVELPFLTELIGLKHLEAELLVKYTLIQERKGTGTKTLTELLVNSEFSENSIDWLK